MTKQRYNNSVAMPPQAPPPSPPPPNPPLHAYVREHFIVTVLTNEYYYDHMALSSILSLL